MNEKPNPLAFIFFPVVLFSVLIFSCQEADTQAKPTASKSQVNDTAPAEASKEDSTISLLDTAAYNQKLLDMVHGKPTPKWPVKTEYPLKGALLPFNRIVAFYGNFYSKGMGILGSLPINQMIPKLQAEVKLWQAADSSIPVIPALHYIAVTAQRSSGGDKKYRLRMPFNQIDKTIKLADSIKALVFIDIQPGHSTAAQEVPPYEKYLSMPQVHLGLDPEYSMKGGQVPCTVIGTMDASDINFASEFLAKLVKKHQLPPKILVVHRFTQNMITNYKQIILRPEVQIVIDMDGFGSAPKKIDSYKGWVVNEPIQFTGFKLFYKQDKPKMMTPKEVLALTPQPMYIQYQ